MLNFNKSKKRFIAPKHYFRQLQTIMGCSETNKGLTFPTNELVIPYIKHHSDIKISEDVLKWYDEKLNKTRKLHSINSITNYTEKFDTNIKSLKALKNYQLQAVKFFEVSRRCIIGYDMGLGKTLIAISILEKFKYDKVLIVCPAYIKYSWEEELQKWSTLKYKIAEGQREDRLDMIKRFKKGVLIVNYEMLSKYECLNITNWDCIIFDESHRLKNNTTTTQNAKKLKSKDMLMLTGSPIAKHEAEIFHPLAILDPEQYTSYIAFINFFMNVYKGFFGIELRGLRKEREYQYVLDKYMLRRLKEDVIDLPKQNVIDVPIKLSQEALKEYKTIKKSYKDCDNTVIESDIEMYIRLNQYIAYPQLLGSKLSSIVENTVIELLSNIHEKCIIAYASKKAAKIAAKNLKCFCITGDTPMDERFKILKKFKNTKDGRLVVSIKALKEGVNIDYCNNMIFTDWLPNHQDNNQFMARIHRMNSTNPKFYYNIIVKNTCQEHKYISLIREATQISKSLNDSERNILYSLSSDYLKK